MKFLKAKKYVFFNDFFAGLNPFLGKKSLSGCVIHVSKLRVER